MAKFSRLPLVLACALFLVSVFFIKTSVGRPVKDLATDTDTETDTDLASETDTEKEEEPFSGGSDNDSLKPVKVSHLGDAFNDQADSMFITFVILSSLLTFVMPCVAVGVCFCFGCCFFAEANRPGGGIFAVNQPRIGYVLDSNTGPVQAPVVAPQVVEIPPQAIEIPPQAVEETNVEQSPQHVETVQ